MACFLVCAFAAVFVFSGEESIGRTSRLLYSGEDLTAFGLVIFGIGMIGAGLFSVFSFRAVLGLPAILSDGEYLRSYTFPFSSTPISEIETLESTSKDAEVRLKDGSVRKINVRMVRDPELFFDGLNLTVG
ncbi:hypothetical protein DL238_15315 [Alteriqipengyuania lutimaris]|uniref:Uncharacterized protein n=1 Tax=Alteriqipengyuania lutimaris TaxID=1538146 RepID=A0A395LGV7_9SPHN|nr:hypothetical protein DL238_15315 [Alteriqipengyuania lutimaris]